MKEVLLLKKPLLTVASVALLNTLSHWAAWPSFSRSALYAGQNPGGAAQQLGDHLLT